MRNEHPTGATISELVQTNQWEAALELLDQFAKSIHSTSKQRLEIASLQISHLQIESAIAVLSLVTHDNESKQLLLSKIESFLDPEGYLSRTSLDSVDKIKFASNCLSRLNRYDELLKLGIEAASSKDTVSAALIVVNELCKFVKHDNLSKLAGVMLDSEYCSKNGSSLARLMNAATWCGDSSLERRCLKRLSDLTADEHQAFLNAWGAVDERLIESASNSFDWSTAHRTPQDADIELVTILYGDAYTQHFVRYCLPSIIQSRGFKELASHRNIIWTFYTTADYHQKLKSILLYSMPVTIHSRVNSDLLRTKEHALSMRGYCFEFALKRCAASQRTMMLVCPDIFYGDGLGDFIERCPKGGVSAAHHFRVFDQAFYRWNDEVCLGDLLSKDDKNHTLVNQAFGASSLYWTRATVVNPLTRSSERKVLVSNSEFSQSLTTYNACPIAQVFRPDTQMLAVINERQGWWYGARPDRWLTATDHLLPWHYSTIEKSFIPSHINDFFCVEFTSATGYSTIEKTIRGIRKEDVTAVLTHGFNFTLDGFRFAR